VSDDSQNAAAAGVSAEDVIGAQERYEEGLAIRREVLGDAHVDR